MQYNLEVYYLGEDPYPSHFWRTNLDGPRIRIILTSAQTRLRGATTVLRSERVLCLTRVPLCAAVVLLCTD